MGQTHEFPARPWLQHWPRGMPHTIETPRITLAESLEIAARRFPRRAAIIYGGARWSYQRLHADSIALAACLQQRGLLPGERVLLMSQNCPQFVAAFHAIVACGAVVVPVNAMSTAAELAHYIGDSGARRAVVAQELLKAAQPALSDGRLREAVVIRYADALDGADAAALPTGAGDVPEAALPPHAIRWSEALAQGRKAAFVPPAVPPEALCLLPYTSGTTGRPKGCMHTHRTLLASAAGAVLWRHLHAESVVLGVAPLFHLLGLQNAMLMPISAGASVVLMPRWDAASAARLIEQHRVSAWAAPPAMLNDFFAHPEAHARDLSSLALLNGGGAAMPQAIAAMLGQRFGITYIEGYGMTETASFIHCNPLQRPKRQCLGIPAFGVDTRIVDPVTLQPLPPGEVGELVTHGEQLMLGYWGDEEANRQAFIELDGRRYLRTGDLACMDEEGYFFMRDRLKRMINVSGYKVWPAELEGLMHEHPDIHEVCVVARADARQGESVCAVIALRPGASADADGIVQWCRQRLAAYKIPRHVVFTDALPKSHTGKVDWRSLQERTGGNFHE